MKADLLIVRHGEAVEAAAPLGDAERWLTGKGRKVTRRVATWLAVSPARRPVEIWTSPRVRAVQTAEILAGSADLTDAVSVLAALSTHGDPTEVLAAVARRGNVGGPLAIVGHEPSLSFMARTLLGDIPWQGFKQSCVLGVSWPGHGLATFRFLLHPKDMTVIDRLTGLR